MRIRHSAAAFGTLALTLALSACTLVPSADSSSSAAPTNAQPAPAPSATEVFTPLLASVLAAPVPVASTDGDTHLAYELTVTNVLSQNVTLDEVQVRAGTTPLLTLAGDDLASWMVTRGGDGPTRTLGPGQQGIVLIDVAIPGDQQVPGVLDHAISISPEKAVEPIFSSPMTEIVAPTEVAGSDPVVISSPVRGDRWFDGNSCCDMSPHRLALNPVNGAIHAPERFAVDLVQLDAANLIAGGPIDDLASYEYEGVDIHAVADGPIVAMTTDRPEQKPGANPAGGLTLDEYGGNYIVQSIGGGRYAFYAHLQPDNAMGVSVGQLLSRGDVIGHLGNSGNSSLPHLHFHIMDSPLPLASNGLPFVIDEFDYVGAVKPADFTACVDDFQVCAVDTAGAGQRRAEGLLTGDVFDVIAP